MKLALIAALGLAHLANFANCAITCRNQEDLPVEWFTVYKVPKLNDPSVTWAEAQTGGAFLFQDAMAPGSWKRSAVLINSTNQLVGHTLNQLYKAESSDKLTYVMYNENSPADNKNHDVTGHAKGFIIFDDVSGIWVTHTIPYFPPQKSKGYSYPSGGHNAHIYGQTIFCASFPVAELNKIARQLWYSSPFTYEKHVSPAHLSSFPMLRFLLGNEQQQPPNPYKSIVQLEGLTGTKLMSFAKDSRLNTEIYSYIVAPHFDNGMIAQGWRHGGGNYPSTCSTPSTTVVNIHNVTFVEKGVTWKNKDDHSNWAVSTDARKEQWTCFGDLSRQFRSFERSGGVLCISLHGLWLSYRKLVGGIETCDRRVGAEFEKEFDLMPQQRQHFKGFGDVRTMNEILNRKRRYAGSSHDDASKRDGSWDLAFLPGYNGTANGTWPFESRRWIFRPHHSHEDSHGYEHSRLPRIHPPVAGPAVPVAVGPVPVAVPVGPVPVAVPVGPVPVPVARPVPVPVPAAVPVGVPAPVPVPVPFPARHHHGHRGHGSHGSWESFERRWGRREMEGYRQYLHRLASHERRARERWESAERHAWWQAEMRRRWEAAERRRIANERFNAYNSFLVSRERSAERSKLEDRKWLNHEDSYENEDSRSAIIRNMAVEG